MVFYIRNNTIKIDKSPDQGKGVFANAPFKKGDVLGIAMKRHAFTGNPDEDFFKTAMGRYINHSDNPNSILAQIDRSLYVLRALSTLGPSQEILVNYGDFEKHMYKKASLMDGQDYDDELADDHEEWAKKNVKGRGSCFFYAAAINLLFPDFKMKKGSPIKDGIAHFWTENDGEIFDPTSKQVPKDYEYKGKSVNVKKNIDEVIEDPLFKKLPKEDQEVIEKMRGNKKLSFDISKRAKEYVDKREEDSGNITYIYSEKHIKKRNQKKAKKLTELGKNLKKLRAQVSKDLKSDEPLLKDIATVVGLIDETYERIGNPESAGKDHHGVTTWQVKHVKFSKGKATIKYVGKSGVGQEKIVNLNPIVTALKEATKGKKKGEEIFPDVNGRLVNLYLKEYNITAKDIRGFHANEEMREALKLQRKGSLPKDQKEKEKKLKEEFKAALEIAAANVGHEPATLKNQYLVPSIEENYLTSGKIKVKAFLISKRQK